MTYANLLVYRISPRPSTSPPPSEAKDQPLAKPVPEPGPKQPVGPTAEMELDLPPSPPPVEDVLAARRAKRLAILAKYAGVSSVGTSVSPSPGPSSAVQPPTTSSSISDRVSQTPSAIDLIVAPPAVANGASSQYLIMHVVQTLMASPLGKRESMSASPTPHDFELAKDEDQEEEVPREGEGAEQVSAADYDPSLDRREDEHKRFKEPIPKNEPTEEEIEVIEEEEEEEEDVDDMFAALTTEKKPKKVKKVVVSYFPLVARF